MIAIDLLRSGPSWNDSYALLSREGRGLRSTVVVTGSPPTSLGPSTVRMIEMRQQPFAPSIRQLDALRSLGADWDSYGGAPISDKALSIARAILTDLSFQPVDPAFVVPFHIAPVPNGGLQIEWRRADGSGSLELWIDPDGRVDALIDRPFGEPRFQERPVSGLPLAIAEIKHFAS